jgi:D-3-phosphoglycerate dehydrogenase
MCYSILQMTRRTVVITDSNFGSDELERDVLGDGFVVRCGQARDEDAVVAIAGDAAALLVQWAPITERVLERLPAVRVVVRYGIGLDNIDLDAAARRGVEVRNIDDYCIDEVACHAVSMIGAVNRRLTDYGRAVGAGAWAPDLAPDPVPVPDDAVGIVGLGRIGRAVASRLRALGHPVVAWDPYATSEAFDGVARDDSILAVAAQVNHLTIHAPATPETDGLVDLEVLTALGPDGHLVNTSRGDAVDESSLLLALDTRKVGWASLDVLSSEPPIGVAARLAAHPRVLVTPHVAYRSRASVSRLRRSAALAVREALSGC